MANPWRIAATGWGFVVVGWVLSPVFSWLVNKIFVVVFDTSKKLKELEIHTIPKLKQTLGVVEEKLVLGAAAAAEDKGSRSDLKILDSMQMDLKSALYEAEDILDLRDYRRIEKDIYLGEDGSRRWVEHKLAAARAWIARCKESSRVAAQRMTRQGQGWRHWRPSFDQFCSPRAIQITGAAQSWHQQLGQLFRRVILCRSGRSRVLLPVSINQTPQSPCLQSGGYVFVPADPTRKPSEEMVDEKEIVVEETQVKEGHTKETVDVEERVVEQTQLKEGQAEEIQGGDGEMPKEIEEGCEGGQMSEEEIKVASTQGEEVGETSFLIGQWGEANPHQVGEIQEDEEEGKEGEPNSSSIPLNCARSVFTWFVKLCFFRDWLYGIVGIKSDKKDGNVPITERIRLRKQIKSIEDILTSSKKSNLLNQNSSSTVKDDDKESSSNSTIENTGNKYSTAKQKEIDNLYRSIEQKVFGRDKDLKHISEMLREGPDTNTASSSTSRPYSVIGIYGITGSGKSTLAQYVCDYEKDAGHFKLIMFILVGKTFSVRDIFSEMLDQIKRQQPSDTNGPEIQKTELKDLRSLKAELEKGLHGKCFLLVLDDLWVNADNMMERGILLDVLNSGQRGSRILVTAQKKDAGAALDAQKQIPIPDMEEDQFLSMFMHYAIDVSQVNSANYGRYEAIGRKIAKKLRRSPIAARTVAARLKSNSNIDFWERTASLDVLNETMGALWWSYEKLGGDISQCFTYCSIFPKGYGIERDEIVRLWIAHGFVKTRNNATEELEHIGQSYFDQLLTFSFLQVRTYFGKETEAFTIHDLLHELAERVSRGDFFRIGSNDPPKDIPRGVHHIFIETNKVAEIAEKIVDMENLRTLIMIIKETDSYSLWDKETMKRNHDLEKFLGQLFMRLTKLRVLIIKLNHTTTEELSVPESINHMKHLHYLGLKFHHGLIGLILPSTFSKLYHIQTIDIPCHEASCPGDMANLINLRHISAPLSFPDIGRLTSLLTLPSFIVKEEPGYELKQLMHLNSLQGTLIIEGLEFVSREQALDAHLTHKEQLRKLTLVFGSPDSGDPDKERKALDGLCPPKYLEELHIWFYVGSRYPSWMLNFHQSETAPKQLHRLELQLCSQLGYIPEGSELFIGLRELCISYCDWDRLPENMEQLVSLQTLEILNCKKIELLPTLPQSLKKVKISFCGMLRSIGIIDCPRLEFILEEEKCLEPCTSQEYCQDTAPTGTRQQSLYPMIRCPCLVSLDISMCAKLVTIKNLPPSLKNLSIHFCGELCSVSGQLGQLKELDIYKCNKLQSVQSLGDASSLETLYLRWCQCLASLGSSGGPGSYLALRDLWIKYCPAMDMKQFNKNVLDGLVHKDISDALSSNPD